MADTFVELRALLHDLDLDEGSWLTEVFARMRPALDEGAGLFVYSYRFEPGAGIRLTGVEGEHTRSRRGSCARLRRAPIDPSRSRRTATE